MYKTIWDFNQWQVNLIRMIESITYKSAVLCEKQTLLEFYDHVFIMSYYYIYICYQIRSVIRYFISDINMLKQMILGFFFIAFKVSFLQCMRSRVHWLGTVKSLPAHPGLNYIAQMVSAHALPQPPAQVCICFSWFLFGNEY